MRLVLWGIDSGDWQGLSAPQITANVLSRVRPGAIIIFHDADEKGLADRNPTVTDSLGEPSSLSASLCCKNHILNFLDLWRSFCFSKLSTTLTG